jgi:hypothetical protein
LTEFVKNIQKIIKEDIFRIYKLERLSNFAFEYVPNIFDLISLNVMRCDLVLVIDEDLELMDVDE